MTHENYNGWHNCQFNDSIFGGTDPLKYPQIRKEVEAQHSKDLLSADPCRYQLENWDGNMSDRRFSVSSGDLTFECFGSLSKKKRLFIFLSAGGGRVKSGKHADFQRSSWHPWMDGFCLNIADPTYSVYPDILNTGWYIGSDEEDAVLHAALLVERINNKYNIGGENTYIVGSSAGGTSALRLAKLISGSTAIAENPPIDPANRHSSKAYARVGVDLLSEKYAARNNMDHLIRPGRSKYYIFQNSADRGTMVPLEDFLEKSGLSSPNLGMNVRGNLTLYCSYTPTKSPHNVFMSVEDFRVVLSSILVDESQQSKAATFDGIFLGLKERKLKDEVIKNLKGWSYFIPRLKTSLLQLPPASRFYTLQKNFVKIPLKENPDHSYRLELNHNGTEISFYIDFPIETFKNNERSIVKELKKLGGEVKENQDESYSVRVRKVPVNSASSLLIDFVIFTKSFLNV